MDDKTYVYETEEVRKTGRTASRVSPTGLPGRPPEVLVEIQPATVSAGDYAWKKWVPEKMLYVIQEQK